MLPVATAFQCPPDCGWCCTHLERRQDRAEARATSDWRRVLRGLGVYHCRDTATVGLSLTNAEADALRGEAERRGMRVRMHPRTYLLETRRREAIVLDWHLAHVSCPFYADFKCTAYEVRPLVCRAYPVMGPAPAWKLAPECPKAAPTREAAASGGLRLGTFLRVENRARHAVEKAGAALDDMAFRILDAPGARFAKDLPADEAARRAARYRVVTPEAFLARGG
jgi:Fe-S-cluster containining protein